MPVLYKDIEAANAAAKTMDIKGQKYIKVSERVKAFRMVYPAGYIKTQIESCENGVCVCRAECGFYTETGNGMTLGIGTAREKEGTSYINKASFIENCETSAVGRALGFAGFGIDYEIASRDEMDSKVAEMKTSIQNEPPPTDALKPGEKVDLPTSGSWNPLNAISKFSFDNGLSAEEFQNLKKALVYAGLAENVKNTDMDPQQFDKLCNAIRANYPDRLRAPA